MRQIRLSIQETFSRFLHWLYFKTLSPHRRVWNMDGAMAETIREYLRVYNDSDRNTYFYYDRELDTEDDELLSSRSEEVYQELHWTFDILSKGVPEPEDLLSRAFGNSRLVSTPVEGSDDMFSELTIEGVDEEANAELREWRAATEARIERNLKLYTEAFRGFWD